MTDMGSGEDLVVGENGKLMPIKIDAHECPYCHLKEIGPIEGMIQHIDENPIVKLPIGFVYRSKDIDDDPARPAYFVIVDSRLDHTHHGVYQEMFLSDVVAHRDLLALEEGKHKDVRERFVSGMFHKVTPEELKKVQEEYGDMIEAAKRKYPNFKELVTSTPEIEELVVERV
jgi:hypothetical protein